MEVFRSREYPRMELWYIGFFLLFPGYHEVGFLLHHEFPLLAKDSTTSWTLWNSEPKENRCLLKSIISGILL